MSFYNLQNNMWLSSMMVYQRTPPKIMGIINLTPDSFSDGGKYYQNGELQVEKAIGSAFEMIAHGATIIDVGGESTKPGAQAISTEEELARVLPFLQTMNLHKPHFVQISLDTYKPDVAQHCSPYIDILNDVTGENCYEVAKRNNLAYIAMDMPGNPRTMSVYKNSRSIETICENLKAKAIRVNTDTVELYIDPGFGKSPKENVMLLSNIRELSKYAPVVAGVSRKRFDGTHPAVGKITNTADATLAAYLEGSAIVRIHDVKQTRDVLKIYEKRF